MAGETVLITGGTGHVGFRVLLFALRAGYAVRAAIRHPTGASNILSTPSLRANPSLTTRLSFVTVADITVPDAYAAAAAGVSYIIHCASPLMSAADGPAEYESKLIQPAVGGTLNILEAAAASPSVKRVVITSSMGVLIPYSDLIGETAEPGRTYDETHPGPTPQMSGPYDHPLVAYVASKVNAYQAARSFVATASPPPRFDVVHLMPSVVLGPNELETDPAAVAAGSNTFPFAPILGRKGAYPVPLAVVHIDDVAELHVRALDPDIPGNEDFALATRVAEDASWSDALALVEREFPDAVAKGVLPNDGEQETQRLKYSGEKTEKVFGKEFVAFEEMIRGLVRQYLDLVGETKA